MHIRRLKQSIHRAVLLLTLTLVPLPVLALPWDGPLQTIEGDLSGTVARDVAVIVFVITGILISVGEVSGMMGRLMQVALGLSFALLAAQWLNVF